VIASKSERERERESNFNCLANWRVCMFDFKLRYVFGVQSLRVQLFEVFVYFLHDDAKTTAQIANL